MSPTPSTISRSASRPFLPVNHATAALMEPTTEFLVQVIRERLLDGQNFCGVGLRISMKPKYRAWRCCEVVQLRRRERKRSKERRALRGGEFLDRPQVICTT